MEYKITNHAKERYAERIMNKQEKIDINIFIATHEEKIAQDIEKMIQYGEILYEGKGFGKNDKELQRYILSGHWIVIIDMQKGTVVTLYRVDFGLDNDFTDIYVEKMKEKLSEAKKEAEEKTARVKEQTDDYMELIEEKENEIQQLRSQIKSLTVQVENLRSLVKEQTTDMELAEREVREVIKLFLTGRK